MQLYCLFINSLTRISPDTARRPSVLVQLPELQNLVATFKRLHFTINTLISASRSTKLALTIYKFSQRHTEAPCIYRHLQRSYAHTNVMANPLLDPTTSDASPHILLHPSVLITINDHATRSGIRHQGPVLGALLGRHDGKTIVVEQAFECGSQKLGDAEFPLIEPVWFGRMLKLQSEVFPELGLVGWYTFGAAATSWHMVVQKQFIQVFDCESPILLLYQTHRLKGSGTDGNLPFDVYERVPAQVQDGGMDVDQDDKFRSISYSLDTPTDEAIGLADIMQGATAANAIAETVSSDQKKESGTESKADGLAPEEDECKEQLEQPLSTS
jgi:hypothetical protein